MLQHLVRLRWDELSSMERMSFAKAAVDLLSEIANPCEDWAMKSQTAAVVAEIVRREGPNLWNELLPSLVSLSDKGPIEAELVVMMLRWLPEDITVHNEDLEGDHRRALLHWFTHSLPEILPLLYNLLNRHFPAALDEMGQQHGTSKTYTATVKATVKAVNAYAEWAPVPELSRYGLIQGCGFLLSSLDFRHHACEFFNLVCQRRRPVDDSASDFDSAMTTIAQILMNISIDSLSRSSFSTGAYESELEFVEYVCESIVALASSCMQYVAAAGTIFSQYVQQMLVYFGHSMFRLHFQSLLFWLVLMKDLVSKRRIATESARDSYTNRENELMTIIINDDTCAAILDISFQRMLKKPVQCGANLHAGDLELWSDDFEAKCGFGQYRSKLLELIRLVALHNPVLAAAKASHRIEMIIKSNVVPSVAAQDFPFLESMQLGLEAVISAVFRRTTELLSHDSEIKFALHRILEGLLQQLLSLKWTEPTLVEILGRYLDSFGPFLKSSPDAVGCVINKLFELLTSLPIALKDPSATSARHARLHICTSFVRIAKAVDRSIVPHMKDFSDTMAHMKDEGLLLQGEHNHLGEAFLIMASSVGIQHQQEVLVWLLEPLNKQWTQIEWQNAYLSDPLGLSCLFSDNKLMWSIFHTLTFFEKTLKRSLFQRKNVSLESSLRETDSSTCSHPMSSHLPWMLPPLLRLLHSIHSLWCPTIAQSLPGELIEAKSISHVEQASLLRISKDCLNISDGSQIEMKSEGHESNENMRNWLKGIRESGYHVLGRSTMIRDSFFRCLDSSSVALALMENVQSMDFRHIFQLIRLVLIPMVKSCPPELREEWLENLLHPLFLHCQQALSCSWSSLLHEGRAKVPDSFGDTSGLDLKMELMEENLLRCLTRELCDLLSIIASPGLNPGLPSSEQLRSINDVELSLTHLDAFASNSLISFLVNHKKLAVPALQIGIEALSWTDGVSVSKVASFLGALTLLARLTNNMELKSFVAKDLFSAIIQGLANESNSVVSADLVGLCFEIFVYLSDRDPAPRQILLSLPCIKIDHLQAFEDALSKTTSSREQRQHMRSLLILATGNNLKALSHRKTTHFQIRRRRSAANPGPSGEDNTQMV